MGSQETIKQLDDKEFLDKLYGFAYKRCNSAHEAEDLCSNIIVAILKTVHKNPYVENFYAFAWTIAHRIYADYCEKRKQQNQKLINHNYFDDIINIQENTIDEYIESEADTMWLRKIRREVVFLSKIYREVMIMYYLDEMKISDIAAKLEITETAVKQRLFSARNTIKKGVEKMNTNNLSLKPIEIHFVGTGNPVGNDPREKAERAFSQNLVYLCRNTERTAKELSELLNMPMLFVEEELEIQCRGLNWKYGLLRKLDNGKYISNFIILDYEDFSIANAAYRKNSAIIAKRFNEYLKKNEKKFLSFPFLNKQNDAGFIAWSVISRVIWSYEGRVNSMLKEKYFSEIELTKRDFYTVGIAVNKDENTDIGFYGCDGIASSNVCGYTRVFLCNIYGKRINKHFGCGHNISTDPQLMMALKAIDGLDINSLSLDEKEIAAKAIDAGYLTKKEGKLCPKILVMNSKDEEAFYELSFNFVKEIEELIEPTAKEMYNLVKRYVPKHLMGEYNLFVLQTTSGLLNDVIEQSIELGTIKIPEKSPCAEGTWMFVTK